MYSCVFEAGDGPILSGTGDGLDWQISSRNGKLHLSGSRDGEFEYDIEDTRILSRHTLVLGVGAITRIYLDGYECWSSVVDLRGSTITAHRGKLAELEPPADATHMELAEFVREHSAAPKPLVEFAAMRLSTADAEVAGALTEYAIHAKFRVRGRGQYGTIFAGAFSGHETIRASVDASGINLHTVNTRTGDLSNTHASGSWSDGRWHHLVVSFAEGAREIFVDGWLCAHAPGTAPRFNSFVIGQSLEGERLMGEVGEGGIHAALDDHQISRLADREVLGETAVFDRFPENIFHRIPALTRMGSGTLVAVADARHDLPNDSPNVTSLVASRSTDSGATWSEPQVIAGYPSDPSSPISATDAAGVEDSRGRLHVVFDLYPAGIGLLNSAPGHGHRGEDLIVTDRSGTEYVIPGGWRTEPTDVVTMEGEPTGHTVRAGAELLGQGEFTVISTGHIAIVTSDDDGVTWSEPRLITHQVKDEWMTFLGIGPGNGIRLEHGEHAGRLLIPIYFSNEQASQFSAAVLISDDDGATWRRSASTNDGRVVGGEEVDPRTFTDPAATMSESALAELPDGRILMFSRSQHRYVQRCISSNAGETWEHVVDEESIPEIFCQPTSTISESGHLYFANAARMLPYRGSGVLYRATDLSKLGDGSGELEWEARTINPRHHGYQSIVTMDGGIGMLWERETAGVWFTYIPESIFD